MSRRTTVIEVKNELGLHARPAATFVKIASKFNSEITLEKNGEKVNGKSMVGILMLAAEHKSKLVVTAAGDDSTHALNAIKHMADNDKDFTEG